MNLREQLRSAACLTHLVPGAALTVWTNSGGHFVVSRHRSDALVDPCQFRAAVAEPCRPGHPRLAEIVTAFEVTAGLIELGGGLYQPTHPGADVTRWFTTTLPPDVVIAVAADCPVPLGPDHVDPDSVDPDSIEVVVRPDDLLGVHAVHLSVHDRDLLPVLDEAAFRLLAACTAEELMTSVTNGARR